MIRIIGENYNGSNSSSVQKNWYLMLLNKRVIFNDSSNTEL